MVETSRRMRRNSLRLYANVEKVLFTIVGLTELFLGLRIWNVSTVVPMANLFSIVIIAGGLVLSIGVLAAKKKSHSMWIEVGLTVLFVFAFSTWVYSRVYGNPSYGTDELAFDQYAASLLIHHINPYTVSMAKSLDMYQVPIIYHTFTLTGGTVNTLSYPAMSFLIYVPLLVLGIHAQAAVYVDCFFWVLSILLMYMMLPRPYKPISLIIGMSYIYIGFVVGGVTDALFIPFLLLSAWRWDEYGVKGAGISRWLGPIAFGIAACIKQTSWFIAPFLVVALYKERKSIKTVFKYVAVSILTFLIPNIPFIIVNSKAWVKGVLAPLSSSNIPSGQGFINISLIQHLGGGELSMYSDAAFALLFALLAATFFHYPRYKKFLFIFPSLVLFFPTRSFSAYLIDLFPAFMVSALTVSEVFQDNVNRFRRLVIPLAFVPFISFCLLAIILPSPLRMKITGVHTTGELQTIDALDVTVENRSSKPATPYFTLTVAPQVTSFWQIRQGPRTLAPGEVSNYVLTSPNVPSMPSINGGFLLDAFTVNPASVSTTQTYMPHAIHTYITPQSVDKPVEAHQSVTLNVQLYDQLGRPVRKQGIPVSMGQVIYDQQGLYAGETSINGAPEGKSPVSSLTNDDGVATFTITAPQVQSLPVYFQAFIQPAGKFPYGYSQIVSIQFQ